MTQEEIKKKYGEVYELRVKDEAGNDVIGYLQKPTRGVLGAVMSKVSSDPLGAMEVLLESCLIREASDMRILDDDDIFVSAVPSLHELIKMRESSLKKI